MGWNWLELSLMLIINHSFDFNSFCEGQTFSVSFATSERRLWTQIHLGPVGAWVAPRLHPAFTGELTAELLDQLYGIGIIN